MRVPATSKPASWRAAMRRAGACLLFAIALSGAAHTALANALVVGTRTIDAPGRQADILIESGAELSLAEAEAALLADKFTTSRQAVPSFGIGSKPVWLHLELVNPTDRPLLFRLALGTIWIDRLDVNVLHENVVTAQWHTGDAIAGARWGVPTLGYAFPVWLYPGETELFVRASTQDPLVLPLTLEPSGELIDNDRWAHYLYGFLYGFLIALVAYNTMIYVGLRERSYLYYALYLISFIALNLAYTGHGFVWWWPTHTGFERYVMPVLIIAYGCSGLLFAGRFLNLASYAPRVRLSFHGLAVLGLGGMALCVLQDRQFAALLLAFYFLTFFSFCMVGLGVLATWRDQLAGRCFLVAAVCSTIGTVSTCFAIWGLLPFTPLAYHGAEFGMLIDATLLALALAHKVRHSEEVQIQATLLAQIDPLSNLYNRRGFLEQAHKSWSATERAKSPLSLIMLDIDHFKHINDAFGHEAGDKVIIEIARTLSNTSRAGDSVSRWGGEEFILLLPGADQEAAQILAERIRQSIEANPVIAKRQNIPVTVSLGVVERKLQNNLEELIREADRMLYKAKSEGRNRVFSS